MRRLTVPLLLWSLSVPLAAGNAYTLMGPGASSCAQWLDTAGDLRFSMLNWVLGYMSGLGSSNPSHDVLGRTSLEGIERWMDRYCPDHPDDNVERATLVLIRQLSRRR